MMSVVIQGPPKNVDWLDYPYPSDCNCGDYFKTQKDADDHMKIAHQFERRVTA